MAYSKSMVLAFKVVDNVFTVKATNTNSRHIAIEQHSSSFGGYGHVRLLVCLHNYEDKIKNEYKGGETTVITVQERKDASRT